MTDTLSESKKELLGRLLRGVSHHAGRKQEIPRRSAEIDVPMSYSQEQIWVHSQFSTKLPLYNEPVTIHRIGPLDRVALERAFTEIIRRHEAWRTTFGWSGGELVQRVQPAPTHIAIPCIDLSGVPAETQEEAALEIAKADALAPFDLATGPMYHLHLIRFSEQCHRLYLSLHHIIFDGVSLSRIFLPELQILYEAFSQNMPSPLAELELQYADYALWQRRWVEEIAAQQLAYWQAKLKGVERRDILRPDHPRPATQSYRGGMVKLALDLATSNALKEVSQRLNATLFMILLATFNILIWSRSGEEDLILGIVSAGRNRSELEGLLGCFLNTVMLRTDLSGGPTFPEVVQQCKDDLLNTLANDGLPFALLVKELSGERDASRHPLFQVLFSIEPPLTPLKPGWKFTQTDVETGCAKFDLHLELDDLPAGIEGRFVYNADLFDRSTIEKMVADWRHIVSQVIADPTRRISQLAPDFRDTRTTVSRGRAEASATVSLPQPARLLQSVRRLFSSREKPSAA
jgi:hypothetical protein